jgi:hypothetical protein
LEIAWLADKGYVIGERVRRSGWMDGEIERENG